MAEESSNEYTPLDLSMKGKATPSTSRDGTQDASSTLGAYNTISEDALRYQGNRQHTPTTDETCSVDGVTDNGGTSWQPLASISNIDKAMPSTYRAGMEQASANSEDSVTNAPRTGRREQRELCAVCGNVSSKHEALHGHAKEHTDDTAHICKACNQSSVQVCKFVEHCRNRNDKNHKCETCGKQFHRAYLVEHYRTHTDERPYKCKTCDKSFRQSNHLDEHKRTHTDERRHKCQICNKSFRQSGHLAYHERTHTGERPYQCQVCNKSFRQSNHLDDHGRTHTGERPYQCQVCNKSFRQSGHLDHHKRQHTGEKPYICRTCGKSYTRAAHLRKHEHAHAEEKCKI
ncbi:uncharacterized protein [Dermacentor andersoni]|uniref:uncharacterized protein isoform X1 n=1 Tax=Dermacentor andersoni TaxID=34620 RepID=UPI003B3AFD1B